MARPFTLEFIKTEAGAGLVLAAAAAVAVLAANSPFAQDYFGFIHAPFQIRFGPWSHTESVLEWTKEGLMAVFFFVVGLEIKYEVLRGELSNPRKLALPLLGAVGGMVLPAAIYLAMNMGEGGRPGGWAIPVATDIAFAVGALALFGRGLPASLRIFLLTLAIADDLGAVVIIALFFTSELHLWALAGAAAVLLALAALAQYRRAGSLIYAFGFLLVWGFTLEAGVNTSIAGVLTAFTVPIRPHPPSEESLLREYMESLHPYVAYAILPFFAFVAAGFSLQGLAIGDLLAPLPAGVMLGLTLGKTVGVFSMAWLAVKLGLARRPNQATWLELFGVCALCGIGFTMSLFIGGLAFPQAGEALQTQIRAGVVCGSVLSLALAIALLSVARGRRAAAPAEPEAL